MDFLKTIADQGLKPTNSTTTNQDSNKSSSGDLFGMISSAVSGKSSAPKQEEKKDEGGFMGALNNAMGGGKKGEEKEDGLDKAIDMFQEHVLKQGPQNNESAIEQKKDDMIADAIRDGYKNLTGKEFFIKEK